MSTLLRLCPVEHSHEGEPLRVEREGLPALAIFRSGDRHFVTVDQCTHGQGILTEGTQEGTKIECPLHGGVFDLTTGKAIRFPCKLPLRTWEPQIVDGWICIAHEPPG